jgi:hypothetical protein
MGLVEDEEVEVELKPRVKSRIMVASLEMVELLSMIVARKIEIEEEEEAVALGRRRTWFPSLHSLIHRLHPGPESTDDVNTYFHTHCTLHPFPSVCILILLITIVFNAVI